MHIKDKVLPVFDALPMTGIANDRLPINLLHAFRRSTLLVARIFAIRAHSRYLA